jgi:GNAT superfamily N-acetyltransferase
VPAGLWRALLESGVGAVAGRAAASGTSYTAKAGAYATDASYTRALHEAGFVPVRHFFRMGIGTADRGSATALPAPDGTTSRSRSDAQRRELHDVFEASFVDHWDHHDRDADAWLARMDALDGHDPDRWWLVRVDGEPAAVCILDDSRLEFGDGYVRTLGVREEFRGRGLARWLLQRAFVEYRDLGRGRVMLMVDSDSRPAPVRCTSRWGCGRSRRSSRTTASSSRWTEARSGVGVSAQGDPGEAWAPPPTSISILRPWPACASRSSDTVASGGTTTCSGPMSTYLLSQWDRRSRLMASACSHGSAAAPCPRARSPRRRRGPRRRRRGHHPVDDREVAAVGDQRPHVLDDRGADRRLLLVGPRNAASWR